MGACPSSVHHSSIRGTIVSIIIRETAGPARGGPGFHLRNEAFSYAFCVLRNGHLGALHAGAPIRGQEGFDDLLKPEPRPYSCSVYRDDPSLSLEHLRLEYPCYGTTDFRLPAIRVEPAAGAVLCDFKYRSWRRFAGRSAIPGLPSTYAESPDEAETLEVELFDELIGATLVLSYTVWRDFAVISRGATIRNDGPRSFALSACASASVDVPMAEGTVLTMSGAWARERELTTRPIAPGLAASYSLRGISGHNGGPFIALASPGTREDSGEVLAMALVYSGNYEAAADTDSFGVTRLRIGLDTREFRWNLEPGESFSTPEALVVWSGRGYEGMSDAFHRIMRTRLARGPWRDRPRPVIANTWEACYWDVNEKLVLELGREAAAAGVELLVVDDGWFSGRRDDSRALGDWRPDPVKFPRGLGPVADDLAKLGLGFGIWMEPEMVSEDSELFRAHPDWVSGDPARPRSPGRNQFVLDLTRPEVAEFVFRSVRDVLSSARVLYLKWDMNRPITEAFSPALPADRRGEFFHRYLLSLYGVIERLAAEFPQVLFESCAGGGGRFDPGMLPYAPQSWTSDDTDAIERLRIQWGASFAYPLSMTDAHVSASPNHQVGRITPIGVRAAVAAFGVSGWELDFRALDAPDRNLAARWTAWWKENRALMASGDFRRLRGFADGDGNEVAWAVVARDRSHAIVLHVRTLAKPNPAWSRLRLRGLDPDRLYRVRRTEASAGAPHPATGAEWRTRGDELQAIGLPVEDGRSITGDFRTLVFELSPAD
ncbi:MAG: alpha-galactosidase [Spirochaetes bacterium]|nr:alpha-galactosidase [Spirochaetota bacterium]